MGRDQFDPVISGISNSEFLWIEKEGIRDQSNATLSVGIVEKLLEVEDLTRLIPLTKPLGLAKIPYGKGCFILDQICWDREEKNYKKANYYISTLLTNLGAEINLTQAKGGKTYIDWSLIGPFDNPVDWNGLDTVYGPETEVFLDKAYGSIFSRGMRVDRKWRPYSTALGEIINLVPYLLSINM